MDILAPANPRAPRPVALSARRAWAARRDTAVRGRDRHRRRLGGWERAYSCRGSACAGVRNGLRGLRTSSPARGRTRRQGLGPWLRAYGRNDRLGCLRDLAPGPLTVLTALREVRPPEGFQPTTHPCPPARGSSPTTACHRGCPSRLGPCTSTGRFTSSRLLRRSPRSITPPYRAPPRLPVRQARLNRTNRGSLKHRRPLKDRYTNSRRWVQALFLRANLWANLAGPARSLTAPSRPCAIWAAQFSSTQPCTSSSGEAAGMNRQVQRCVPSC